MNYATPFRMGAVLLLLLGFASCSGKRTEDAVEMPATSAQETTTTTATEQMSVDSVVMPPPPKPEASSLPEPATEPPLPTTTTGHASTTEVKAAPHDADAQASARVAAHYKILTNPSIRSHSSGYEMATIDPHNATADEMKSAVMKADSPDGGFPWPPPPCSTQADLPDSFFAGVKTLGEADERLRQALKPAGYQNPRYYPLPAQPGFAIVTRYEQIKSNCEPMPEPARWSLNTDPCPSLAPSCISNLLFPCAGHWRAFVFVVTERNLPAPQGSRPNSETALEWFEHGTNRLPRALRNEPFTADHYGAVLVYEFEKKDAVKGVVMLRPSLFDSFMHLRGAGIMP